MLLIYKMLNYNMMINDNYYNITIIIELNFKYIGTSAGVPIQNLPIGFKILKYEKRNKYNSFVNCILVYIPIFISESGK